MTRFHKGMQKGKNNDPIDLKKDSILKTSSPSCKLPQTGKGKDE